MQQARKRVSFSEDVMPPKNSKKARKDPWLYWQDSSSSGTDDLDEDPWASLKEDMTPKGRCGDGQAGLLDALQEEELVDWIEDYPLFYDNRSQGYNDQQLKDQLWEQKARELGVSSPELIAWFFELRSLYISSGIEGKTREVAGDATARER